MPTATVTLTPGEAAEALRQYVVNNGKNTYFESAEFTVFTYTDGRIAKVDIFGPIVEPRKRTTTRIKPEGKK